MGYYTEYQIKIIPKNPKIYQCFVDDTGFLETSPAKWYRHEVDCLRITNENPGFLIILAGKGEEPLDVWKKVFYNGKLVWQWKVDQNIPEVPQHVLDLIP